MLFVRGVAEIFEVFKERFTHFFQLRRAVRFAVSRTEHVSREKRLDKNMSGNRFVKGFVRTLIFFDCLFSDFERIEPTRYKRFGPYSVVSQRVSVYSSARNIFVKRKIYLHFIEVFTHDGCGVAEIIFEEFIDEFVVIGIHVEHTLRVDIVAEFSKTGVIGVFPRAFGVNVVAAELLEVFEVIEKYPIVVVRIQILIVTYFVRPDIEIGRA